MVYEFIKSQTMDYRIETLCKVLGASRSAYYAYCKGETYVLSAQKASSSGLVKDCFDRNKKRYGSRRISKELEIGRYAVRSRMKEQGLTAIQPKSFVPKTTNSRHKLGYAPNLLPKENLPQNPDAVYVGDITYLPTTYGKWLYLSSWMDLYTRKIVGWKIEAHMEESIVIDSLRQALYKRSPGPGTIIHSDRGGQYASLKFRKLLNDFQCRQSMSAADNPYDNAFAESFFSRFKAELLQKRAFESIKQAEGEVFEFIEMYYNTQRLHSGIGYCSPANFEKKYYEKLKE